MSFRARSRAMPPPACCCSPRAACMRPCARPPSAPTPPGLAESFHGRPIVLPRWSAAARRHHRHRGDATAAGVSPITPQPQPSPPTGSPRRPHTPPPLPRRREASPSPESSFPLAALLQLATRDFVQQFKLVQGVFCNVIDS